MTLITAALLVIGDEILSGRTKDKNIGYIAEYFNEIGITLQEVRIIPDEEEVIVTSVNALRHNHTYLFTTGGIGPTHDDITADCIAKAFDVPIDIDPRALALLRERYTEAELTPGRLRMARIPSGASLIENPVSKAPGFRIGNVIVMAGVPAIMQAMLDHAVQDLEKSAAMLSRTIDTQGIPEGVYATRLGETAALYPEVKIGSYPAFTPQGMRARIVLRALDGDQLEKAAKAVEAMLEALRSDGLAL